MDNIATFTGIFLLVLLIFTTAVSRRSSRVGSSTVPRGPQSSSPWITRTPGANPFFLSLAQHVFPTRVLKRLCRRYLQLKTTLKFMRNYWRIKRQKTRRIPSLEIPHYPRSTHYPSRSLRLHSQLASGITHPRESLTLHTPVLLLAHPQNSTLNR